MWRRVTTLLGSVRQPGTESGDNDLEQKVQDIANCSLIKAHRNRMRALQAKCVQHVDLRTFSSGVLCNASGPAPELGQVV